MSGVLALVGGAEWTDGCDFDAELLTASGRDQVVVLATAAAFENPAKAEERATTWFKGLGAQTSAVPVYSRASAMDEAQAGAIRDASFIYLSGGSAMHLRSVLMDTPVWTAVTEAHADGAVLAAAGASATVLCDAMVDPRGGGFSVGLGLVDHLSLIPRYDRWSIDKSRRTEQLAPKNLVLVGIPDRAALIRDRDGTWRSAGATDVTFLRGTL